MVTYYVVVNKNELHKKSGLLPSEKYGLSTVSEFPFATNNYRRGLDLYTEFKGAKSSMNPKTQTILKIESEDLSFRNKGAGNTQICIYSASGNSFKGTGEYVESNTKLKVVSQILPNGKERTKDDARHEEMKKILNKDENPVLRAATYILKKGISKISNSTQNRNESKENIEKPRQKM